MIRAGEENWAVLAQWQVQVQAQARARGRSVHYPSLLQVHSVPRLRRTGRKGAEALMAPREVAEAGSRQVAAGGLQCVDARV